MAPVDRNGKRKADRVNLTTNLSSEANVLPSPLGNRGSSPTGEFSQENWTDGSPRSPRNHDGPLSSSPSGSTDRTHGKPLSPGHINIPSPVLARPGIRTPSVQSGDDHDFCQPERISGHWQPPNSSSISRKALRKESNPITHTIPYRQSVTVEASGVVHRPQSAFISSVTSEESSHLAADPNRPRLFHARTVSGGSNDSLGKKSGTTARNRPWQPRVDSLDPGLKLKLLGNSSARPHIRSSASSSPPPQPLPPLPRKTSPTEIPLPSNQRLTLPKQNGSSTSLARPSSTHSSSSELGPNLRARSPQPSPNQYDRAPSTSSRRFPESRPLSYVDLLNVPYPQPPPAPTNLDNAHLRTAVGNNASLLSTRQTLDMYRANVKKTNDPTIQYEFAIFMVNTAQEAINAQQENGPSTLPSDARDGSPVAGSQAELLREARQILQRLADRSYPFAQYYLADGYSSGLFSKGVEDYDRAFPLFVAASKHGHAEAGYRAALCYEFGWGTRKDPQKAVQFFRQSASKNHPGAMARLGKACLVGDLGLGSRYREGLKWLKRAAESADYQYNSAPYELGLLHETGYGDDIFQDQSYAAQLFTQSADLGHTEASYRLGDAYEHGKLGCPRDPALSVHFYTGAAQRDHPLAQMALCAWYMVGAEPVLEKDEYEAYEWARKAAESGEMGR